MVPEHQHGPVAVCCESVEPLDLVVADPTRGMKRYDGVEHGETDARQLHLDRRVGGVCLTAVGVVVAAHVDETVAERSAVEHW